jgi:hypothetical protein
LAVLSSISFRKEMERRAAQAQNALRRKTQATEGGRPYRTGYVKRRAGEKNVYSQ